LKSTPSKLNSFCHEEKQEYWLLAIPAGLEGKSFERRNNGSTAAKSKWTYVEMGTLVQQHLHMLGFTPVNQTFPRKQNPGRRQSFLR